MARTGRPRAFDAQETLVRARDLFWSHGYSATSIQDLVDGLSVQRGSLYGAFGDKRSLYLKAVALYAADNRAHLETVLAVDPVLPALRRMLTDPAALVGMPAPSDTTAPRRGCLVGNTTVELVPDDDDARNLVSAAYDGFVEVVTAALARGQVTGEVRRDTAASAQAQLLLLVFQGLALVSRAVTDPDRLALAVDVALEAFRP